MILLDRNAFDYVPYYCEENVWRLLARRELSGLPAWAVIVSTPARDLALLRQRAGRPVDGLVRWDYHVFALVDDRTEGLFVLDLDTDLPFPCPASRYLEESFRRGKVATSAIPYFRLIPSAEYRTLLASDRSHMRRPDGSWIAPPPPWPRPGEGTRRASVILSWTDMSRREPGRVLDAAGLGALAAERERLARRLKAAR